MPISTSHTAQREVTIAIDKEYLKFSAAHFTIFSATERERLHGHNFGVSAVISTLVGANGMASNYRVYKDALNTCCQALDEYLLLPSESPYLTIEQSGPEYHVAFGQETMRFLAEDTLLLPIRNTTVEEFSYYILAQLLDAGLVDQDQQITGLDVTVESGPGQRGTSRWRRDSL